MKTSPTSGLCKCGIIPPVAGLMLCRDANDHTKFFIGAWCGRCGGLCASFDKVRCGKNDVPIDKFRRGWGSSFGYVPKME